MSKYHLYLVSEDTKNVVADVVVAANDEHQAKDAAWEYFASRVSVEGCEISPEWSEAGGTEADIHANAGPGTRTISF